MKTATTALALTLAAALLLAAPALAQYDERAMQEKMAQAEKTMSTVGDFIKDVRFDEKFIQQLLTLWPELETVGEEAEWELDEESSGADLEAALDYPAYVAWTKKHGLDRETWLRKAIRVQMMIAQEEYEANKPTDSMMAEQMKQMEKMKDTLSEEMYQQMIKGMKEAMGAAQSMDKSMQELPKPTPEEQTLLENYPQLREGL